MVLAPVIPLTPTLERLTPRQRECAALLCDGLTRRHIADLVKLSPKTVEYHLHQAAAAAKVDGDLNLVVKCWREAWLSTLSENFTR